MNQSDFELSEMGSADAARAVFERFYEGSKAYRDLVNRSASRAGEWKTLPLLTKKSFYDAHPWRDIVPRESYRSIYSILRSSGTTNTDGSSRGFFWPQLKDLDARMEPRIQSMLVETYQLDKRKTLVIIGMSLGSWAGGEQLSFFFKTLALHSTLPLVTFSPGNQHAEILEVIEKCHEEFDQILIVLCPSAIFYLDRTARQRGRTLPLEKISFLVTGEPFPEDLRLDLQEKGGHGGSHLTMLSLYGSADTGMLGYESLPLIRLRQRLVRQPDLAARVGFEAKSVPNLYHAQLDGVFLEAIDGELIVTKWQGVPLVRYNLEDKVKYLSWRRLCLAAAENDPAEQAVWEGFARLDLPDVVAVSGRSKGCVFLCGSNIFETMLQEVLSRSSLKERSTGAFVAWTDHSQGRQVLSWQIELKAGVAPPSGQSLESLHREFVALLGEQQPEFGDDYERFYRPLEGEGLRIFTFFFCESPKLSDHPKYASGIKRKVLVEHGPFT
jgi:phenylacetate-CoA ligase